MDKRWAGQTVVILASGPSLTEEDCETVRAWHAAKHGRVICINRTHRRAPWADVLYGCDYTWWQHDWAEIQRSFHGERWTQDEQAAKEFGLNLVQTERGIQGLSKTPGVLARGDGPNWQGNSGYQAINLAYQWGATRIVLLGYDMRVAAGRKHWHEPHVIDTAHVYTGWLRAFPWLARDLEAEGVDVINATRETALDAFPKATIEEALSARVVATA